MTLSNIQEFSGVLSLAGLGGLAILGGESFLYGLVVVDVACLFKRLPFSLSPPTPPPSMTQIRRVH
jgi:hypothetical protein